uniref:C3H1-type domain-containing protein n=1 Tax=Pyrodinium bahamense TaxID=73915 RepID=A0A7S0AX71_9DINO
MAPRQPLCMLPLHTDAEESPEDHTTLSEEELDHIVWEDSGSSTEQDRGPSSPASGLSEGARAKHAVFESASNSQSASAESGSMPPNSTEATPQSDAGSRGEDGTPEEEVEEGEEGEADGEEEEVAAEVAAEVPEAAAAAALTNRTSALLSRGSAKHNQGTCKPCLLVHTAVGCRHGTACRFCHQVHSRRSRPRPSKNKRDRQQHLFTETGRIIGRQEGGDSGSAPLRPGVVPL